MHRNFCLRRYKRGKRKIRIVEGKQHGKRTEQKRNRVGTTAERKNEMKNLKLWPSGKSRLCVDAVLLTPHILPSFSDLLKAGLPAAK